MNWSASYAAAVGQPLDQLQRLSFSWGAPQAGHFEQAAAPLRLTGIAVAVDQLFAEANGKRPRGAFVA